MIAGSMSLQSLMMSSNRGLVLGIDQGTHHRALFDVVAGAYAYHLDNKKLIAFLKEEAREAGVEHIDAVISDITLSQNHEEIECLLTSDRKALKFDLYVDWVPLRDRCSFGRFPWLISQALSVTYMAGERRLYLERNCRLPESPAHSRRRNREGPASSKGLNSQRGFGPAVEPRRKSRPRSTSLHGSSPCKCQRLSTLRWDRLPPSRPSTKSGACAGGRRLSDRRLHRWLAGTSASAPSSHGAADLLGLNRAHICVRNRRLFWFQVPVARKGTGIEVRQLREKSACRCRHCSGCSPRRVYQALHVSGEHEERLVLEYSSAS